MSFGVNVFELRFYTRLELTHRLDRLDLPGQLWLRRESGPVRTYFVPERGCQFWGEFSLWDTIATNLR